MENKLICIAGPTASGKTALSVALAKIYETEIISADSMQIYQHMDIGTAKPTLQERQGIVHHMLDIADPTESFSVARFVEMADSCAQDILSRGKIPIVAGGTGLYMDALIACDTFSGEETDHALREKYMKIAQTQGNLAVHDLLRQVDPVSAERLHPNNVKRVIRALEVYEQTGMTIDALNAQNKRAEPKYHACIIALCPLDREQLYARIDARVDQMLADGLLEETRHLWQSGKLVGTAAQAIGYKEFLSYLTGATSLSECVALLKRRTRNYAKRQLTWLKRNPAIHWIRYEEPHLEEITKQAQEILEAFL